VHSVHFLEHHHGQYLSASYESNISLALFIESISWSCVRCIVATALEVSHHLNLFSKSIEDLPHLNMSRLASFQGPSTPSKSPVNPSEQVSPSPSSKGRKSIKSKQQHGKNASGTVVQSPSSPSPARPNPSQRKANVTGSPHAIAKDEPLNLSTHLDVSGFIETAVHKRLRQTLFEVRSAARKWEEATKVDGFKAAKDIVDARTLIEYMIPAYIT
jgi:hypothetical protein